MAVHLIAAPDRHVALQQGLGGEIHLVRRGVISTFTDFCGGTTIGEDTCQV